MKISIPVNLNETHESKPVPTGKYELTIATCDEAKTKAGDAQLKVSVGIDGHDTAPNVTHFLSFPNSKDDANKANFKALMMRRFLTAFAIPYEVDGANTSFDTDDFLGAKATCEVTLSEPDDNGNVYNRLNLPRIKDEDSRVAGLSDVGGKPRNPAPPPKRAVGR